MAEKKTLSLVRISLLQAFGLITYCGLVGVLFWGGNEWFGKMSSYWAPVMFLSLFVVSVLICALITFAYPVYLFWDEKKTKDALTLVAYTAGWLASFVLLLLIILLFI